MSNFRNWRSNVGTWWRSRHDSRQRRELATLAKNIGLVERLRNIERVLLHYSSIEPDVSLPQFAPFKLTRELNTNEAEAILSFWRRVHTRFSQDNDCRWAYAVALAEEAEWHQATAPPETSLNLFLRASETDCSCLTLDEATRFEELAEARGGEAWVRFQISSLRLKLDQNFVRNLSEDEADSIRETYSELLDENAENPTSLSRIKEVGKLIIAAERAGRLPTAFVRRSASRN